MINGYVFGNLPGLDMTAGQRVRWYLRGMGSEVDLHTAHWHGDTVVVAGMRTDVSNLLPATMQVADMVADDPGSWLFHCHINDHSLSGMQPATRYRELASHPPPAQAVLHDAAMAGRGEDALRGIDLTACPRSCADCFAGSGRN